MDQSPMVKFENDIAKTRRKFKIFQGMASRTNRALWEALRGGYEQILDYRHNAVLRVEFDRVLAAKKMRSDRNMLLTITEYIFFPHVLHPGTGHKPAINRASIYAAVYQKALAENINEADFVSFIRRNGGIQKIATAPASQPTPDTQESQPGKGTRRKQLAPSCEAPPVHLAPYFRFPRLPDGAWYCNARLADKAAEVLLAAQSERQRVHLVMYVHRDDWVVVGVSSTPYEGPTPVPDQNV